MNIIEEGIEEIIIKLSKVGIPWKNQRVLITGGAGFLGSWLAEVLVNQGTEVIVIDNLSSGMEENLTHHLEKPNFKFLKQDVTEPFSIKGKIDYIFHLASQASPFEFVKFPIKILKANTLGILNTLELAVAKKANFLYTSTSEIYGNPSPKHTPTPETYNGNVNPIGPRSCYDEAKRVGESFVMAYILEFGINARIVRIFNTFGPRMRSGDVYGRVIPNFIAQALRDEPITVFGNGHQTRSFLYVIDQIEGILRAAYYPQTSGEVINIGSTLETPIISLARIIREKIRMTSKITFHSLPIDDPERRCPDITKAYELLDWEPHTPLDEGLDKFIEWYKTSNKII